jgi:colanic acid biosynthesis glycosyl transferase WcaI
MAIGFAAASAGSVDAIVSFGGPPLLGPVISGAIARLRRAPLLTVIHDLYPDVAIDTGALRNAAAIAATRWLERLQLRLSRRVVVLGETTKRTVVRTGAIPPAHVSVLPVWLDPNEIVPGPRDNEWRRSIGIGPDKFMVLYAGTSGLISGAEMLARVAAELPPDVVLTLVGGGSAWKNLSRLQAEGRLPANLRLLPYQPRERLAEVQAASDLSLITLLPGRGRTSVPSKLQGYMAAGRPVLVAADDDCDTTEIVRRERIGRVVPPGDATALASAIQDMRAHPDELVECGRRARVAFERAHAREPLIDGYAALLVEMVEESA